MTPSVSPLSLASSDWLRCPLWLCTGAPFWSLSMRLGLVLVISARPDLLNPSFVTSEPFRPEAWLVMLFPYCDLPVVVCSSSKESFMTALARPAAQSARKRLIEGMQAVIMDRLSATDVQIEGVTALKGRSSTGES